MREIKFRAWDSDDKRMLVDGDIYIPKHFINDNDFKPYGCFEGIRVTNKGIFFWFCPTRSPKASEDSFDHVMFHWKNCELMQFTGLFDKNRKEIYEGDIVEITIETTLHEWEHKERLTVVYKCASFCLENERRSTLLHKDKYESEREIIGNIYENQELLGVK